MKINFIVLHRTKLLLVVTIFSSLLLSSCKQDFITPNSNTSTAFSENGVFNSTKMNDAKHWFENMKNTPSFVGAEGLQPLWDKALSYGNKMEIPILFEGMSLRMSLIKSDTNHFSKSRLVLYKRGKNQYDAYILNFVPSNSFNKDINSINVSNYKEKKFDGKVFISGLDNQIMGVYNIVNGIKSNFSKIKI